MDILIAGLNHRTASLDLREQFAFTNEEVEQVLPALRKKLNAQEIILLSTCNRTELLAVTPTDSQLHARDIAEALLQQRPVACQLPEGAFYEHRNLDAVRHLLRVATGLDSMVLGEPEILGQLKDAYAIACRVKTTGVIVNKMLHTAFHTGKRARTETDLGLGAVSVASVAITLAQQTLGALSSYTALVIGAGNMAQTAARHLKEQGVERLLFVNRSQKKAECLAHEFNGEALPFGKLLTALEQADIVLSSTSAPDLILTHELFHKVMDKRHTRPIFLIDIAIPRDIDPEIQGHDNAALYHIDHLKDVADANLSRRAQAVPDVEAIVDRAVESFQQWLENRRTEPLVKQLLERFDEIRAHEVSKTLKYVGPEHVTRLNALTEAIQSKLLHSPIEFLRTCDLETEEGQRAMELVRKLFGL